MLHSLFRSAKCKEHIFRNEDDPDLCMVRLFEALQPKKGETIWELGLNYIIED